MARAPLFVLITLALSVGCGGSATDSSGQTSQGGPEGTGGSGGSAEGTGGAAGSTSSTGGTTGTGGTVGTGGMIGTGGMAAGGNAQGPGAGGMATGGMAAGGMGAGGDMACDTGTPPANLPTINGTFIQADDTHMPPMQTGGDPAGTWVFDKATVYLPSLAKGLVDTMKSTATGTAWARLETPNYSVQSHLDISLSTSFGAMMMTNDLSTTGTYTVTGATLNGMATCGSMGTNTIITLTRTSPTTGTFLIQTTIMTAIGSGDVFVLLEGTVSP